MDCVINPSVVPVASGRLLALCLLLHASIVFPLQALTCRSVQGQAGSRPVFESGRDMESRDFCWRQKLQDHQRKYLKARQVGVFLRDQVEQGVPFAGVHLNAMHETLFDFARSSEEILAYLAVHEPTGYADRQASLDSITWLAGRVMVTESVRDIVDLFGEDRRLRHLLRRQARFEEYRLSLLVELRGYLLNRRQQVMTMTALHDFLVWSDSESGLEVADCGCAEPFLDWLLASESWRLVSDGGGLDSIYSQPGYWFDNILFLAGRVGHGISRGVGTAVAKVRWRRGYLYQHQEFRDELLGKLLPLDILLRKRNSALTNYTVPGHWGHSAVWLGTREQLMAMGLWDHPAVQPFQNRIKQGYSVYEVQYNGLHFATLDEFLDLDEVAAIRVTGLDDDTMVRVYGNLYKQKEKKYDYSFNIMSPDRVVCTEIIFLSFADINWPRTSLLGRTMILPDHLAELVFYGDTPLHYIAYFSAAKHHQLQKHSWIDLGATVGYTANYQGLDNNPPLKAVGKQRNGHRWDFSLKNATLWVQWRPVYQHVHRYYTAPDPHPGHGPD